jgi:hypothetical protein
VISGLSALGFLGFAFGSGLFPVVLLVLDCPSLLLDDFPVPIALSTSLLLFMSTPPAGITLSTEFVPGTFAGAGPDPVFVLGDGFISGT